MTKHMGGKLFGLHLLTYINIRTDVTWSDSFYNHPTLPSPPPLPELILLCNHGCQTSVWRMRLAYRFSFSRHPTEIGNTGESDPTTYSAEEHFTTDRTAETSDVSTIETDVGTSSFNANFDQMSVIWRRPFGVSHSDIRRIYSAIDWTPALTIVGPAGPWTVGHFNVKSSCMPLGNKGQVGEVYFWPMFDKCQMPISAWSGQCVGLAYVD